MHAPVKRGFDLILATSGVIFFAPVYILVALAIRLSSGSPVLYRGYRMGKGGFVFGMYKFRTMHVGSHQAGSGVTGPEDPRVTAVGHALRRWKVDELPQLVNVLQGHMSLVGPRPEDPRYLADYAPYQHQVLAVRPGITGPTQIAYRHEEQMLTGGNVEEDYRLRLLPLKLDMDLEYVRQASLLTDVKVILLTAMGIFSPTINAQHRVIGI